MTRTHRFFRGLAILTWTVVGLWILGRLGGQIDSETPPTTREFWALLYFLVMCIATVVLFLDPEAKRDAP